MIKRKKESTTKRKTNKQTNKQSDDVRRIIKTNNGTIFNFKSS